MIGTVEETEHSISGAKKYYAHSNEPGALDRLENPGRMYEVNINADPEDFLDWDKPLSQQSEKVRSIYQGFGASPGTIGREFLEPQGKASVVPHPEKRGKYAIQFADGTYRTDPVHGINDYRNPELAAYEAETAVVRHADLQHKLREAGIPGIKYLDQMSRTAGDGSRNYVVFDDALVEILRKYANPPTAATVPLGLSGQNESDDDFLSALLSRYGVSN